MRFAAVIKTRSALRPLIGLAALGLSACSNEAANSTVTTEQRITQDISAVRGGSTTTTPSGERMGRQRSNGEQSAFSLPSASVPSGSIDRTPAVGNPQRGHDFAIGTCTPCHIVSTDQRSPFRFADAPDFRVIANAPGTTALGLNIWLTNPHPTMPKLVLYPQEAADVIAYILSLQERR